MRLAHVLVWSTIVGCETTHFVVVENATEAAVSVRVKTSDESDRWATTLESGESSALYFTPQRDVHLIVDAPPHVAAQDVGYFDQYSPSTCTNLTIRRTGLADTDCERP